MADAIGQVVLEYLDEDFKTKLRDSKGRFVNEVTAMQKEADRVSVNIKKSMERIPPAFVNTQKAAFNTSRALSGLSGTASLLPGPLGDVTRGLTAAGRSAQGFYAALGPVGLALAAVTAAIGVAAVMWRKLKGEQDAAAASASEAADKHAAAMVRMAEANDKAAVAIGRMTAEQAKRRAMEREGLLNQGQIAGLLEQDRGVASFTKRQSRIAELLAATEARVRKQQEIVDAVRAEGRQQMIVLGLRTEIDFIENDQLRTAKLKTEQLRKQVEHTQRFKAEQKDLLAQQKALAQNMAVQIGMSRQADFIQDPMLRRLTRMQERIQEATQNMPNTPSMSIGGGSVRGPVRFGSGSMTFSIGQRTEDRKISILERLGRDAEAIKRTLVDVLGR